jgi:hypothetical protein
MRDRPIVQPYSAAQGRVVIRQIFCFLFAGALFGGGLLMLYDEVFVGHAFIGRYLLLALFLTILGGYWLWIDFGEPLLKRLGRR